MTKGGGAKKEFHGVCTGDLRMAESHRVSSERAEQASARFAEEVFRPLIRELFDVLPLRCVRAEIVSLPSGDDAYDVSGVKFFADPLTNAEFSRFAAKSPYWKGRSLRQDERFKGRSCVSDYCGDYGGTLFNAFALDGSCEDEVEKAMADAYRKFKAKAWPGADRCLRELDLYAFSAERTSGGAVSFKVFGFNPNSLSSVAELRRKRRAAPCR